MAENHGMIADSGALLPEPLHARPVAGPCLEAPDDICWMIGMMPGGDEAAMRAAFETQNGVV